MPSRSQALTRSSASAWDEVFTGLHGASRIKVPDRHAPWTGRLEWQQSKVYGLALCSGGAEEVNRDTRHIQNITARSPVAAGGPHMLSGVRGLGRVIRELTTTLHEEREQLSETSFDIACDRLLDLVCLAAEGADDSAPTGQRATVEAAIRRYIRQHACDTDLDVVGIARALGWSVRYVQQVLQAADTTSRDLIRRERLNVARARLVGASWAAYSIAEIAHSCGFGSHASFATAFRAEFGMTPREARQGLSCRKG
ncbi:helix-turn-helix transcriptional regulator [Streptomyces sp. NPDC002623]